MIRHRNLPGRRVREVYLRRQDRQDSRLVDICFGPYVRPPPPPPTDNVHAAQIGSTKARVGGAALGCLMFMCVLYITRLAAATAVSLPYNTAILSRSSHVRVEAPAGLSSAAHSFFVACSPVRTPAGWRSRTTLVQGCPPFFFLEGPGKTDRMQAFPRLGPPVWTNPPLRFEGGYSFWEVQSEMAGHAVEMCRPEGGRGYRERLGCLLHYMTGNTEHV